jgi:hypothetical protein
MRICLRGDSEGNLAPLRRFISNSVVQVNINLNLELAENKLDLGLALGGDFLPNPQLSLFCQILQILYEYTHPNVSRDQVSNRIDKKWQFETENG